jgi:hypothetical protein
LELNHGDLAECNALARPLLRRLRTEADINHLTIPAQIVENDPNPDIDLLHSSPTLYVKTGAFP